MKGEFRQQIKEGQAMPHRDREYWDGRAQSFSNYAIHTPYSESFLKLMDLRPDWTVLDMACGGGTLAIPLAPKVKRITAVDFSRNMLSIVEQRCREHGIANIDTILGQWADDWDSLGIGEHDVAIASRSLPFEDASPYIKKLDRAARRQVYISIPVGSGPIDAALYTFAGRDPYRSADYIHFYHLLYDMGIPANVVLIKEAHRNRWKTHEEALEDQRWMFHGMTSSEEELVQRYLRQHLIRREDVWQLPYERTCYWAVMWWIKE
ncbi:MAG TPA: class I SAM-dependent methyltransferase [Acidobacteriota bacterium]|nr:class I SAM-dependent methyltransferase [Acidobacteriota bacterium]